MLSSSVRMHLKWVVVQAQCWDGAGTLLVWVPAVPAYLSKYSEITPNPCQSGTFTQRLGTYRHFLTALS